MPRKSDWAHAYNQQAVADLQAAMSLGGSPISVLGMLLQMSFEKASKAALLYGGRATVEDTQRTHRAALSLMSILKNNRIVLQRLTSRRPEFWHQTVVTVEELTNLQPQVSQGGPWLEYPWISGAKETVRWPEEHLAPRLRTIFNTENQPLGRLPEIFKFAELLTDNAASIFGSRRR